MTTPTPHNGVLVSNEIGGSGNGVLLLLGIVILAILAATVTLAWHGTLNGEAASGIIFAILSGVLGAGAHAAGTRAGSQASVSPPPDA